MSENEVPEAAATPPEGTAPPQTAAEAAPPPPPAAGGRTPEERNWAMGCHLASLAGYFFPFANIFGPLIVWAIQKDRFPLVDDQGKESMNFQISMTLYILVAIVLCFVLIGIPLLIALILADLVLVILAAVKAGQGEAYRYPMTIRFIT